MIQAAVISNGIQGLDKYFPSNDTIHYTYLVIGANFDPDLMPYDLLIVPNGTDQIAVGRLKQKIHAFLETGKTLFCFDGWFTDWIPNNQWVMDNTKKTIDIRYSIKTDRYGLFEGVDVNVLTFSQGISGWWACGYIVAAPEADVVLEDTWQRPMIILDEKSTNGRIFATASGPMGDSLYGITEDMGSFSDVIQLYRNCVAKLLTPIPQP